MSKLRVFVAVPDLVLRRSVEFMLMAHGYEAVLRTAFADDESVAAVIVDETAIPIGRSVLTNPAKPVIVLSAQSRPVDCPLHWRWLEKSHLGQTLHDAIEGAFGRTT